MIQAVFSDPDVTDSDVDDVSDLKDDSFNEVSFMAVCTAVEAAKPEQITRRQWLSLRRGNESNGNPSGQLTTSAFTFKDKPWALVWSLRGDALKVIVNDPADPSPTTRYVAIDRFQEGQGISYVHESGTFSLSIDARGEWAVKLVSIEGEDDYATQDDPDAD